MMTKWKQILLITAFMIVTLSGIYWAFYRGVLRGQKTKAQHRTPDQVWSRELERMQNSGYQPSLEEEEVTKMLLWMSYLTDKIVTAWLEELDNQWYPPLSQYEPTWPRCWGGISQFLDLNPPPRREYIDEHLRSYVFVDEKKGELVNEPTSSCVPWSGRWELSWHNDATRKEFEINAIWFRYPNVLDKEWPAGEKATYHQIHGSHIAAIIHYKIQRGSFSGPVIGDDSFFIVGSWFRKPEGEEYSDFQPAWLYFKKHNFRVIVKVTPANYEPATDEERAMIEKVAKLVESQIIAYSLFGLDKFTLLKVQSSDGQEYFLPAGRISSGNYLVPVRYVVEFVTGERPIYEATQRQMKIEMQGKQVRVQGELVEAANRYVEISEEERFVARRENLWGLFGLRTVQDVRFEQ